MKKLYLAEAMDLVRTSSGRGSRLIQRLQTIFHFFHKNALWMPFLFFFMTFVTSM